jgi:hypothetical protein
VLALLGCQALSETGPLLRARKGEPIEACALKQKETRIEQLEQTVLSEASIDAREKGHQK